MSRNNSKEYSNFLNKFLLTTAHKFFLKFIVGKENVKQ